MVGVKVKDNLREGGGEGRREGGGREGGGEEGREGGGREGGREGEGGRDGVYTLPCARSAACRHRPQ